MPVSFGVQQREILRFRSEVAERALDALAIEEPLNIRLATGSTARSVAITMRTPGQDEDLALGFLFTESILTDWADVQEVNTGDASTKNGRNTVTVHLRPGVTVDWDQLERHSYVSSSCGVCGKTSLEQVYSTLPFGDLPDPWQVPADLIPELPRRLRAAQVLFEQTGGIHAAGLFTDAGTLLHFAEDVGRHNALDKLIGNCIRSGQLPLRQRILVLSGRASFELVQKAAMAGVNLIVAVGAPSSLAVALAEELGVGLCGFVRQGGFNCYVGRRMIQ